MTGSRTRCQCTGGSLEKIVNVVVGNNGDGYDYSSNSRNEDGG